MKEIEKEGLILPNGKTLDVYDKEFIPFGKFYDFFASKPQWSVHMQNFDSPFMKLL